MGTGGAPAAGGPKERWGAAARSMATNYKVSCVRGNKRSARCALLDAAGETASISAACLNLRKVIKMASSPLIRWPPRKRRPAGI